MLPFYAETSDFQLYTAIAFATAAALLFSTKRNVWEYKLAGIISLYVAFDERFMFHECIRLSYPSSRNLFGGDLTVFVLGTAGITGALWGINKLSKRKYEMYLFILAGLLCSLGIYLDVFEKTIFYLELDTKIEETSEMGLAIVLILVSISAGVRWRVVLLAAVFIALLVGVDRPLHQMMWGLCPKLKGIL